MELPVHRVTMEWPETLAVLRDRGIRTGEVGGRPVGLLRAGRDLAEALYRRTRWRSR